jgi:hypothetical protein
MRVDGFALVIEVTSSFDLAFVIESLTLVPDLDTLADAPKSDRVHGLYMTHDQWLVVFDECGFDVCVFQTDTAFMTTLYVRHECGVD